VFFYVSLVSLPLHEKWGTNGENGEEIAKRTRMAQWAAQVLTTHYPGRVYALLRQISEKDVEAAQMEVFERSVMDDVVALELAAKYATTPD